MSAPQKPKPSPLPKLYGRQHDLTALKAWLRPPKADRATHRTTEGYSARLKVLWGAPGVGKTRLTRALCEQIHNKTKLFHDRLFFIDLSPCTSEADLLDTTAAALCVPIAEGADLPKTSAALAAHWRACPGSTLLVLDNFEQMHADAVARVLSWLGDIPSLYVLVTTRIASPWPEPCRLNLHPLPTDTDTSTPTSTPSESPAHALFLARALPLAFDLDPTNPSTRDSIDRIVRALDGLPLALELAAARLSIMSLPEIEARLSACLPLLDHTFAGVPKSLYAALDASWSLLPPSAQRTLARCAVFHDSVSLRAAEAILCDLPCADGQLLNNLQTLVDASLLHRDPVRKRFSISAPVRAFAATQLAAMGQTQETYTRFCAHFAQFASQSRDALRTAQDDAPLIALANEREHLKATIEIALGHTLGGAPIDFALSAALGLDALSRHDNAICDVLNIFRRTLSAADAQPCDPHLHAELIASAWRMARIQGQRPLQATLIDRALSLLSRPDLSAETASVIHHAAAVHHWSTANRPTALEHANAALSTAQHAANPILQARALTALAWLASDAGDHATCIQHAERGVYLLDAHSARYEWLTAANNLAIFYKQRSALDDAADLFVQLVSTARALRCAHIELHALQALAAIELTTDHPAFLEHQRACAALEQRLSIPQIRISNAINDAWHFIFHAHNPPAALDLLHHALALQESHGVARMRSFTLQSLAELQLLLGHHSDARLTLDTALSLAKTLNNVPHLALLLSLSASAHAHTDPSVARELLRQATLQAQPVLDDIFQLGIALETFYTRNLLGDIPADPAHPDAAPHLAHLVQALTPTPPAVGLGTPRPPWQLNRYMRGATARVLASIPAPLRRAVWTEVLNTDPQSFLLDPADPYVVRLPQGDWLDLNAKPVLARVLGALLALRARGSLSALDPDACIAAGWPGERILADAAQTRLQQVISRLRREGLADTLENVHGGYRIAASYTVSVASQLTARPLEPSPQS